MYTQINKHSLSLTYIYIPKTQYIYVCVPRGSWCCHHYHESGFMLQASVGTSTPSEIHAQPANTAASAANRPCQALD